MKDFSVEMVYYNHRMPTPNWEILDHISCHTNIAHILKGEAVYYINEKPYHVHAGDLICTPPGSKIRAHSFPNNLMEAQCISFHLHTFDQSTYTLPFSLITPIGHPPELDPLYLELQKSWLMKTSGYKLQVQAYLLLILDRLFQTIVYRKNLSVTDCRIRQAVEYILSNFNKPISLSDVAALVDLSPMYFGNLFRQQTGVSFRQYITSIRLNQAENMLMSGEYRVGEVARLCGFSDAFYFSKKFHEQKGISPSKVFQSGYTF